MNERFTVTYRILGTKDEAIAKAWDICLEETVELPFDLVPEGMIRDAIIGRVEDVHPVSHGAFHARISFSVETTAFELTQLLNVTFGNISLKPGIRIEGFDFPPELLCRFRGPRFGRDGLRKLLGVPSRPLLCSAIKPMGLSVQECADLAYRLALGGIDIIKDDHGLTDQVYAPFKERTTRCATAVRRANEETGMKCVYMPNVTAGAQEVFARARLAKDACAGALLIAPGLTGYDAMRSIADDDSLALPVMCHPSFQGSFVVSPDSGIAHEVIFAQFARLAGADATIFPNYGGRFSFSRDECSRIAKNTGAPLGEILPMFPTPAGGMTLERIRDMSEVYANEVIYLIGAGLFRHGSDLIASCREFRRLAQESSID